MRLQRANRFVTILVASLSLASMACVLVSGYFRHRQVTALNTWTQSLLLSIQLAEGVDNLTAAVRVFAVAGDLRYRDAFQREVRVERSRERAVEGLQSVAAGGERTGLPRQAKFRSEGARALQSGGVPLGLFTHNTYEPAVLALEPRASLHLVTKAVIESPRGASEFGATRIERLLANVKADSASQICETVLQQAYAFGNSPWTRFYELLALRKTSRQ